MRIGVQQAGACRAGEQEPHVQQAGAVALLRRSVADDRRQRGALDPLGDDDPLGVRDDVRHAEVRVAVVRHGECLGRGRLEVVVELLGDAGLQLRDERRDVEAGDDGEQPRHPPELTEVGQQRLAGAGVLHLDRDLASVDPDRSVHLPDRCCRGRMVVEGREPLPPVRAELFGEDAVMTEATGKAGAASWSRVSAAR